MKRICERLIFAVSLMLLAGIPMAEAQEAARPRNVIMFISDGCGPASFTLARDYLRHQGGEGLIIDGMFVGSVQTYAANDLITDSASSATAYACGIKTYNGAIGVDTLQQPVATLLEAAEAAGMATGLVATSRITHATPASYSAHVVTRADESTIAAQQLGQGIEVFFGGGRGFFLPQDEGGFRRDGLDLLVQARERGYQVIDSRAAFEGDLQTPVLGLFTNSHMAFEVDRDAAAEPSLAEMTAKAIDLLKADEDGFFLMVEGSRIDHAGHGNDIAGHLHDILAFDQAIGTALDFAGQDGQTLVVSTSDHETGGLTIGRQDAAWQPEVLDQVSASLTAMIQEAIDERMHPCLVLENRANMTCTEEERAEIDQAIANQDNPLFLMGDMIAERVGVGWTTFGHTAVDVNLYATGPGSEYFIGNHDNTYIGWRIADLMGFDLAALTAQLREKAGDSE